MRKMLIIFTVAMSIFASGIITRKSPGITVDNKQRILGGWNRRGFFYVFGGNGVMKAVKIAGNPIGFRQYKYSMFTMSVNDFIKYDEKDTESAFAHLLLVDDVRDSSAVIAFGTPFARADSGKGMFGRWERSSGYKRMVWIIKPSTVQYTEILFDLKPNSIITIDDRRGRYRREKTEMSADAKAFSGGRFHIRFEDGRESIVLPVLLNGLMYLFDLTSAKALFTRSDPDSIPTYKDYKSELEKRKTLAVNNSN